MVGNGAERISPQEQNVERIEQLPNVGQAFVLMDERSTINHTIFEGKEGFSSQKIKEASDRIKRYDENLEKESKERKDELEERHENDAKLRTILRIMLAPNANRSFLTDRKCHMDTVSRYDQLFNYTSLMLHVEDQEATSQDGANPIDLSLDVTTNADSGNVDGMFKMGKQEAPRNGHISGVDYYCHGEEFKSSKDVPRFVIGISTDNIDRALEKCSIIRGQKEDGTRTAKLECREMDTDIKFKVLSEVFEQTESRIKQLEGESGEKRAYDEYVKIRHRIRSELACMMGIDPKPKNGEEAIKFKQEFEKKYAGVVKRLRAEDEVYDEIVKKTWGIKDTTLKVPDKKVIGKTLGRVTYENSDSDYINPR